MRQVISPDGDPLKLAYAVGEKIGFDRLTIAGSVGNEERMDEMKKLGCHAYTMGSALFNSNFVKNGTFRENLQKLNLFVQCIDFFVQTAYT